MCVGGGGYRCVGRYLEEHSYPHCKMYSQLKYRRVGAYEYRGVHIERRVPSTRAESRG